MKNIFLFVTFTFLWFSMAAQWSPTTGPWGGTINQFYEIQETLFTVTGNGAGAVFKSLDGGQSWEICNKGLPLTYKLPAIYGDQNYIYVGSWLNGIYRSDDLGNSWSEANNGISENGLLINAIYETAVSLKIYDVLGKERQQWIKNSNICFCSTVRELWRLIPSMHYLIQVWPTLM